MAGECTCGCCGPTDDDTTAREKLEQERREAYRRVEELERRVRQLETSAGA